MVQQFIHGKEWAVIGDCPYFSVYIITYGANGIPTVTPGPNTDWISVGGDASFAPAMLFVVNTPVWAANNPHVIEANVRADDSAN